MNIRFVIITVLIAIGLIGGGVFLIFLNQPPATKASSLEQFAQCLSNRKVTMYGSASCSHCLSQKHLFGDAFKYVPYVECSENPQLCVEKNINGYPTWIFPDGSRLEGEQSLSDLSQKSSCPLPTP